MIVGKFTIEDLNKLVKKMALSRSATTFTISIDGPKLLVNYSDDDGKLITITLFDSKVHTIPTITKTDYL